MGSKRKSVDDAVAGVPASLRANSVVQHFYAAPDTKMYEVLLRNATGILQGEE
jgi:hypothetical protein